MNANSSFKELLVQARAEQYAIGAFNIFDYLSAKAAIDAANTLKTPIILQTSTATVVKFGPAHLLEMINLLRKGTMVPVIVHLDHCTDPALAKTCIDEGWDSVMLDMSEKPLDENIANTAEIKKYADKNGCCVEGELGIISGVEEEISSQEGKLADYNDSIKFLEETNIDAFAPAIGTAHGLYKKEVNLNFDLIKNLASATSVPLVIHGGTGLQDSQFKLLIKCGASKINVSTALKYAYIDGLRNYWDTHKNEYNPIKLNNAAEVSIKKTVEDHILRFKLQKEDGKADNG